MSDYSKLKELAEALESATSQYLDDETNNELGDEWSIANDRYVDASSPEVVLGLIRDAEQSEQDYKDVVGTIELRDFEIARLKAELKKTDADRKACWAEFKVQGCHLDQVKAECEGLRKEREGKVLIPAEPSDGLLMSMAIRKDHALGCPGYYDQKVLGRGYEGVSHARMVECAISEMRKLHEEVVGTGFYSPEKEADYAAMSKESAQ